MKPAASDIEAQLQASGLELAGRCLQLSETLPLWRHDAPLLEELSQGELDILGTVMPLVRARAQQALITEGDTGDWMLFLLSGTVDVVKQGDAGELSRLAVIRPGASIGEMSMLDGAPRYATCRAIGEVQAGVLTRDAISLLIREHPAIGAKLLVKLTQLLAQRLRNTSNQLVKSMKKFSGAV